MDPEDRSSLSSALRSFVWLFLAFYAASTLSLWFANVVLPDAMGPVTNYTVSISLILAVGFGGLYAAWSALRPERPKRDAIPHGE